MNGRRHAIIVAHPDPESFTATMAGAYASAVRALGDTTVVRDLYKMDFDPCLQMAELPWSKGYCPPAEILGEREILEEAEVFAFFYPLWFNAPPAMMKGYVDRVFGMGFGFAPKGGAQSPLLKGRQLISFTSSGAPETWLRETGAFTALISLFDQHLADMCGLTVVAHHHFGGVTPGYPIQAVSQAKEDVRMAAKRYFSRQTA